MVGREVDRKEEMYAVVSALAGVPGQRKTLTSFTAGNDT
jgi:hypothetical protein